MNMKKLKINASLVTINICLYKINSHLHGSKCGFIGVGDVEETVWILSPLVHVCHQGI